eukprot:gene30266-36575_t
MSGEDLLAHAVINIGKSEFYNGGNYTVPPKATGAFLFLEAKSLGVVGKSDFALTLFHFKGNEAEHYASTAIKGEPWCTDSTRYRIIQCAITNNAFFVMNLAAR